MSFTDGKPFNGTGVTTEDSRDAMLYGSRQQRTDLQIRSSCSNAVTANREQNLINLLKKYLNRLTVKSCL
jgi:hypothetical protein